MGPGRSGRKGRRGRRLSGPPDRPLASVIVVTHEGRRFLAGCLESLLEQKLSGGFEVVLVDNASSDGSAAWVRQTFPAVRLLEPGRNLGFAAGNNAGIEGSRGRYAVLLNNDTRVRTGWLEALVGAAESDRRVAAVTAKLVYAQRPRVIQSAGSLLLSDGSGADRGMDEPDLGQYDKPEEVFGGSGASLLLRRSALADAGLLDADFFMYYEDTDLCWRLRLRGWSVLYEPGAVVEHEHSATSQAWSPFFTFHVDRNRLFMILKNARPAFVARAYAGFLGRSATRAGQGGEGRVERPARRQVRGRVAASFAAHLPGMLAKRATVRAGRRVTDREIEAWLYPREEWDARSA